MLFVPLPLVVALLLFLILASILRGAGEGKANRPFLALILLSAVQSTLVGLRWGYQIEWLRFALPIMASMLPPLAYASFRSLMNDWRLESTANIASIVVPPVVIAMLLLLYPVAIDMSLIVLFVGYAIAIVLLGRRGPDGLEEAQFASVVPVHRALYLAAAALCLSAVFDILVLIDFHWARGENAGVIISNGNLLGLLLIGLTAWVAGDSKPEKLVSAAQADAEPVGASAGDHEVMARLEALMAQQRVYRDENLNLSRLARKLSLPSRQISNAINRATGGNVSQYINQLRVQDACRLLEETDQSVTAIMFESGFQTKSNFNREFRRITGMSPLAWRERQVWTLVSANKKGHPEEPRGLSNTS
ncbi:helix-turn-helix transcriptional regulator [Agrobacterium rubi]|uniref:helix-turn-helix domain-containing protein n=1 Tax=Agrobacterium rubi TaxID=28099 RepID=UPI001571E504|nr:helix-turn-helix transcriptional regulator [Agrobacterium rubi]NTF18475.1 helix-turn-helix transcriptional regulator [Agrobacterium rubi]NTF25439.1 helix-turn-helix transcriptional regulator [Agrobacterium rubi]